MKRTSLLDEIKAEAVEIAENVRDIRGATDRASTFKVMTVAELEDRYKVPYGAGSAKWNVAENYEAAIYFWAKRCADVLTLDELYDVISHVENTVKGFPTAGLFMVWTFDGLLLKDGERWLV